MLKYLIRDLYGALRFLPAGIGAGALTALLLAAVNNRRRSRGKAPVRVAPAAAFCMYLAVMVSMTLLSRENGDGSGIDLQLFSTLGINKRNNALVMENVLLFLPYGFIGAWNFPGLRKFAGCALAGLLTSLGIELLLFFTKRGFFQLDDILTNLAGAVLGWVLFRLAAWRPFRR